MPWENSSRSLQQCICKFHSLWTCHIPNQVSNFGHIQYLLLLTNTLWHWHAFSCNAAPPGSLCLQNRSHAPNRVLLLVANGASQVVQPACAWPFLLVTLANAMLGYRVDLLRFPQEVKECALVLLQYIFCGWNRITKIQKLIICKQQIFHSLPFLAEPLALTRLWLGFKVYIHVEVPHYHLSLLRQHDWLPCPLGNICQWWQYPILLVFDHFPCCILILTLHFHCQFDWLLACHVPLSWILSHCKRQYISWIMCFNSAQIFLRKS